MRINTINSINYINSIDKYDKDKVKSIHKRVMVDFISKFFQAFNEPLQ